MELTKEQAFGIVVQAIQQGKFTLAEADTIRQAVNILNTALFLNTEPQEKVK